MFVNEECNKEDPCDADTPRALTKPAQSAGESIVTYNKAVCVCTWTVLLSGACRVKYSTERGLRKAVEKKIGYKLSNDGWANYAPDWSPPYDNNDLREITKQIPHAKPQRRDLLKSAYVRSDLIPKSVQEWVDKARFELFGSKGPPFEEFDSMRAWIMKEAESQPLAEGHAPRFGYKMERETSLEELRKLYEKKPGRYGLEFATLAFPSEDNGWVSHVIVSDGTRLRRLWLTVRMVAKRLDCQEAQATAYILTGVKPLITPITVEPQSSFHNDGPSLGKLVLTIREPLSTEDVLRIYKEIRKRLWGHKRDHKLPTDKDCALVSFIQPRLNPEKPNWDGLRVEWNREYQDWSFDNWRYLKIYYERAKKKIYPSINFGPITIKN